MRFLSKAEAPRHIWKPCCAYVDMTTAERGHIDSGNWLEHEIEGDNLITQIFATHCIVRGVNDITVLPESDWPENQEVDE